MDVIQGTFSNCALLMKNTNLLNFSIKEFISFPLFISLFTVLVLILIYYLCLTSKSIKKIFLLSRFPLNHIIIYNVSFEAIAIFLQLCIFFIYENKIPISFTITNIFCLTIYFLINMFALVRTKRLEQTQKALEAEQIYNKTLSLLHDNLRCFKHDFNNIIQSIGGYIALNDMDGLRKYYNNLFEDCKQTNNLNLLNPDTINNPSIYSLLTKKYFLATEKGIKMNVEVFTDLSNINFNIYELTRILGILLDNAIEAAQYTEEKLIDVELKSNSKKQLFIISNSCNDDNISVTKIFEKGYSTKESNSGIGLWKVHNILSKRENADLFTTVHNHKFMQQLEIFYKE